MAEVFEAVSQRPGGFHQRCVIKRILPHLSADPGLFNMFVAEARLSGQLQHPNIVQVFDFGVQENRPFLAMEYIDGIDLSTAQRRAQRQGWRLPVDFVCYVVSQIAAGLDYAHRRTDDRGRSLEIVHRDVSLSNIMMTAEGGVKLLDFGIAKAAAHLRDEQTRTSSFKGKLAYMSPQQAGGEPIDHRSDQFSLGVVFYECLTQTRLFRGENDLETLARVRAARVSPPSGVRPEVTADIDAVVMRLLAAEPGERFASCGEVVEALAPILHERHADARVARKVVAELVALDEPPPPMQLVAPQVDATGAPAATRVWPMGPRRRAAAWAGGAFALVALGAIVWLARGANRPHAALPASGPAAAVAAPGPAPGTGAPSPRQASGSAQQASGSPQQAGGSAQQASGSPQQAGGSWAAGSAAPEAQATSAPTRAETARAHHSAHKGSAHADGAHGVDRRALLSGPGRIVDPYAR